MSGVETMSIKARLEEDMKNAMRERESGKFRLSVIRMARAAIKNMEIDKRCELTDEQVIDVLSREVKMRWYAFDEFSKAGRGDLAEQAKQEIDILLLYLPAQLNKEEIGALVETAIQETGAAGAKDMGKVMSLLGARTKGRADGRLVSLLVKEALGKL
jgi:uncharacterized protein YqeY